MDLLAAIEERLRSVIREEVERALASNGNGKSAPLAVDGKEAARLLGLPVSWVMNAARRGEIKSVKHGHHVRFVVTDLNEFIRQKKGATCVPD
jgi:excisionase family DNA binding protein